MYLIQMYIIFQTTNVNLMVPLKKVMRVYS